MAAGALTTPLLEQYEGVKARYPGHLVLFRVGDFYETFGEDARLVARELDVVLTARAPDSRGERTPMAGVPHHAVDTYLGRLVRKGYKVALCDQVEDAKLAKGLVRREVTRVVTPGTVVEEAILGGPDSSYLACVALGADGHGGYSAVDVSTGEWLAGPSDAPGPEGLVSAVAALRPREILFRAEAGERERFERLLRTEFPRARLEPLTEGVGSAGLPSSLGPSPGEDALVALTDRYLAGYLRSAQPRLVERLTRVDRAGGGRRLLLDAKTLRHLEVHRPMNPDDPSGPTLLDALDVTLTAAGRRTLAFWLTNPLADVGRIEARQDAVERLVEHPEELAALRAGLKGVADIGRIATRIASRRARPDELVTLRTGLDAAAALADALGGPPSLPLWKEIAGRLRPPPRLSETLHTTLPEEIARGAEPSELFRPGHAPEVDAPRAEQRAAIAALTELERREQLASGIKGLKVGYNQVFGYYFEVTRPHLAKVPAHFRRRQTVAQAERFVSDELDGLAERIARATEATRVAAEARWSALLEEVDAGVTEVHRVARALGELDVLASFAQTARDRDYRRPTVDGSTELVVRDARHPVLDRQLGERLVANDVELDGDGRRLLVLTGPNMSGKSTYMRTVGLLVLLAQAGSFVPARFARVGLVDRLFTRMGFTDEIGRGKSSFMVEMLEAAEILRSADDRSLVLLDEVGRGTSTFDGLAIAWAILRHLHDVTHARTILATHYHQLTRLVAGLAGARNGHFAVQDRGGSVVFLHRLVPGATEKSYGVHVARLAGIPPAVLKEAESLLAELEAGEILREETPRGRRGPGRHYTQAVLLEAPPDPLAGELSRWPVDSMTEEELRRRLSDLQRRLRSSEGGGS